MGRYATLTRLGNVIKETDQFPADSDDRMQSVTIVISHKPHEKREMDLEEEDLFYVKRKPKLVEQKVQSKDYITGQTHPQKGFDPGVLRISSMSAMAHEHHYPGQVASALVRYGVRPHRFLNV